MQSHILFSFTTRVKIVIFFAFFLLAVFCTGCSRKKRDSFTQTIYAQDGSDLSLTDESQVTENDSSKGSQGSNESAGVSKYTAGHTQRQICVFVCGAVMNEGVYYLAEGSRVIDAVNAAGGYRVDADRNYVNQAEYVYDAERVSIPTIEEAEVYRKEAATGQEATAQGTGASAGQSGNGLININTASKTELMEIPGIGESKAERIISYRENHGRFGSIEEIRNVSGIGSSIYEGLKNYITVE